MRRTIIALLFIFGMISFSHADSPLHSRITDVITPVRIINQSDYDSDVFIDGFLIGTFKSTEEANLTMTFREIKIVLNNSVKTTFTIKPGDIPEKCILIVIRNKKVDYCPANEK